MKLPHCLLLPILLSATAIVATPLSSPPYPRIIKRADACTACVPPASIPAKAPHENIWLGLTDAEVADVVAFLTSSATARNLDITLPQNQTAGSNTTADTTPAAQTPESVPRNGTAAAGNNTLLLVELLLPNKTDALHYANGKGAAPPRYAHAVLDMRKDTTTPYILDLQIGPLPISPRTRVSPLTYPYNHGTHISNRLVSKREDSSQWLTDTAANMSDITMKMWGGQVTSDGSNDTITIGEYGVGPVEEEGRLVAWDMFSGLPEGGIDTGTLLPLGLYIRSDLTGSGYDEWSVTGVLYNDIFYPSLRAFRKALFTPGFEILGANVDGSWASTDREGPIMPGDDLFPPIPVAPQGSRYRVDAEKMYVEWMDFSFFIAFSRDTGVRLFDLRFKGERIVYEVGLMEAMAIYAGNDPVQSGTAFFDSLYGLGATAGRLLPGYDCPSYATFLNTTTSPGGTPQVSPGSLCIFETDSSWPLFRHSADYTSVAKNIFFTLRSISTVGNYDYMLDYTFYTDGSMQIEARASGYIRTAYFAGNGEFGYRIHDNLSGSMHDHVLNYKLDLDILGTANSLSVAEFVPTTHHPSWSKHPVKTFKIKKSLLTSEDSGKINWHPNAATSYSVINKDHSNKFGEYRGYKIKPLSPGVFATVHESSILGKAADWAHHNLFVTKRKDTEACSSHAYASYDLENPPVRFGEFFDGEGLEQEDLVLWFNIGMHHAPATGDLPTTTFASANGGVRIEPMNYFEGNPGKQSRQMVRIGTDSNGNVNVTEFGNRGVGNCSVHIPGIQDWGMRLVG
ncbi:amine oxidase catalytic domain-containing protein [Wilcoxina mikolae CBS 423.85]|nr:amine oxidase catalytic domain-containing protein [Wilcoxina mikolae CBS 423.85]